MSTESNNPGSPPPALLSATEKLLRPLVRLLISFQITFPILANLLKSIYVDVADEDFRLAGKRQSDSRINLLTGIHRKDVKRLRAESPQAPSHPENVPTGARIVSEWLGNPDYLDSAGKPVALPFKAEDPGSPDFARLVESVVKQDIRPRVILDEWIRLGVATLKEDLIVLNSGAFTPKHGMDEKLYFFGKNTQDHLAASSHNILGGDRPFFDRSVYYDKLTASSVIELEKLADSLGMDALTTLNKKARELQKSDQSNTDSVYRINFGVFNYNNLRKPDSE